MEKSPVRIDDTRETESSHEVAAERSEELERERARIYNREFSYCFYEAFLGESSKFLTSFLGIAVRKFTRPDYRKCEEIREGKQTELGALSRLQFVFHQLWATQ